MFFKLLCPANFLLNLFETFEKKHVEVGIDSDPSVRFTNSSVLEHETHPLLLQLEGGDGVPRELNDLVLQAAVLTASL